MAKKSSQSLKKKMAKVRKPKDMQDLPTLTRT